MADDSGCSFF